MSHYRLQYEYFSTPNGEQLPDRLVVNITRKNDYIHFDTEIYNGADGMKKCSAEQASPEVIAKLDQLQEAWKAAGCAFTNRPNVTITDASGKEVCVMGIHTTGDTKDLSGDKIAYQYAVLGKIHDVASAAGMRFTSEPGHLRDSMIRRDLARMRNRDQNPENLRPITR